MSKIRLVGGPFGGKVENNANLYGQNELVYRGPKKMTRKQQYEWMTQRTMYAQADYMLKATLPQVEARYRISRHPQDPRLLAMHPDGSIFYEYVEGSKREFP